MADAFGVVLQIYSLLIGWSTIVIGLAIVFKAWQLVTNGNANPFGNIFGGGNGGPGGGGGAAPTPPPAPAPVPAPPPGPVTIVSDPAIVNNIANLENRLIRINARQMNIVATGNLVLDNNSAHSTVPPNPADFANYHQLSIDQNNDFNEAQRTINLILNHPNVGAMAPADTTRLTNTVTQLATQNANAAAYSDQFIRFFTARQDHTGH